MSEGNSCIVILDKKKMSFFPFTKVENRRVQQVLSWRVDSVGEGKMRGKGIGG
jgi:hypothetical protein